MCVFPKLNLFGIQLHQLDVKRFSPDVSGEKKVPKYLLNNLLALSGDFSVAATAPYFPVLHQEHQHRYPAEHFDIVR